MKTSGARHLMKTSFLKYKFGGKWSRPNHLMPVKPNQLLKTVGEQGQNSCFYFILIKKVGSRVIKNSLYFKSDKKASNSGRQIITLHIVNTLQYEINDYQVNFIFTLVP